MNLDIIFVLSLIFYTLIFLRVLYLNDKKLNIIVKLKAENFKLKQNAAAHNENILQEMHKESFIKFISDSRESAYKYIEDVQKSINEFIINVEPEINYFKKHGDIIAMEPNYNSLKKITEAYDELKKILPEDNL
jgi:hypothetical protein